MRHGNKNKILDRQKAPREMMLRNMAASVLLNEKVKTTVVKAKAVRPLVEKAITLSKDDSLNNRRKLAGILPQKKAVVKAFTVLGKRYEKRSGGYTRITKLGVRQGDGAAIAQIELV